MIRRLSKFRSLSSLSLQPFCQQIQSGFAITDLFERRVRFAQRAYAADSDLHLSPSGATNLP